MLISGGTSQTWRPAWTKHISKSAVNCPIQQCRLYIFRALTAVTTIYTMPHPVIGFQLWHSLLHWVALDGTGATEANFTINQKQTILARVLEVTEVTAVDMHNTLHIQDLLIHSTLNICMLTLCQLLSLKIKFSNCNRSIKLLSCCKEQQIVCIMIFHNAPCAKSFLN